MIKQDTEPTLMFGQGNAKLDYTIATFSLPSGYACPGAEQCLARASRASGKITDGPENRFRCFSASQESMFQSVRKARWNNFEMLKEAKSVKRMAYLIMRSLPESPTVRIHVAGDFYSQNYFDAWLEVCKQVPGKLFYAYTKSLTFWIARLDQIPKNLVLNASRGGKFDVLIDQYHLKCAEVVFSEQAARDKGLELDHDDSHAYKGTKSFGLLIHGAQPSGTEAAKAVSALRAAGITGYSRNKPLGKA